MLKIDPPKDEAELTAMLIYATMSQVPHCVECYRFASHHIMQHHGHRKYTCEKHTDYSKAYYSDINSGYAIMLLQMMHREGYLPGNKDLERGVNGIQ